MVLRLVPPALLVLALAAPAPAQTVTAADPSSVAAALQALGYRAEVDTDSEGDPRIRSSTDGKNFSIFFYGCTANANCRHLQFSAGFDLTNGTTQEVVNDWNRDNIFGTAWRDEEGDVFLKHLVTTTGGLSPDTFRATLDLWSRAVGRFKTHIDW